MIIRDGDWTLFSSDLKLGRFVWKMENPDGTVTFRTDYRADGIMDANHAARMDSAGQKYGDWRRIASVPLNLHYDQMAGAISQRDDGYMDRWLREHDKFKTFR